MQFKELDNVILLTLPSGKKRQSHCLGLVWKAGALRVDKGAQADTEAGALSVRPARLLKLLSEQKLSKERWLRGGAGRRLGRRGLLLEPLMLGPYLPAPCRLLYRKEKSQPGKVSRLMSLLIPHIAIVPARNNIPAAVFP